MHKYDSGSLTNRGVTVLNRSYRNTSISAHQRKRRESATMSFNMGDESFSKRKQANNRDKLKRLEELKRLTRTSERDRANRTRKKRGIQTVYSGVRINIRRIYRIEYPEGRAPR